jgi:3-hydroxyisobutyrate dehydrogenase-like beta-hydroxyacid dehydrogenase
MDGKGVEMIGIVNPGAMGTALGADLIRSGHDVAWASNGRGPESARRAHTAGFVDVRSLDDLAERCEVIFAVCPPGAAVEVAGQLAGYRGVYVDANAISPRTAESVAALIRAGGGRFVDGGIIGTPPSEPGSTRLYLSGPDAHRVRSLFTEGLFSVLVLDETCSSASKLKMTYAAWTKISAALLLATRETATNLGVWDALSDEWALSQPQLRGRLEAADRSATEKGWRWIAEMQEIATTFEDAGTPKGFGDAAADLFAHYSPWPAQGSTPT